MIRIIVLLLCMTSFASAEDLTPAQLYSIINERSVAINQRFESQEKAVSAALAAAKEATTKAETSSEKRFEAVNEFRSTLKDQQAMLVSRTEVDVRIKSLEDKIIANNLQITQLISRAEGASQLWGFISVALGLVVALLVYFMKFRRAET